MAQHCSGLFVYMADDLSLLFRLRGDAASLKQATAEGRAAVNQLKQSFGPELTQTVTVANKAFADISDNLTQFAGQRIPLVGNAFVSITNTLRGFSGESIKTERAVSSLAASVQSLAQKSGKSATEITGFLRTFTGLSGSAARNEAAFKAFGGSVDLIGNKTARFLPELEQASGEMAVLSAETAATATTISSLAGPVALATAALAAQIAVVVVLTKETFALAKASADYQGKLFDLSQQIGVSVETLSALEVAALQTGGSLEGLVQSLGIFQRKLEEAFEDEGSKAAVTFRRLGVEATDTEAAFRQTLTALARMPEGFRQTATALELFGRSGKAILAVAKESNGDIDALIERLRELGLVTTEQAKLADEFNDQLVLLQVQLRGLGTQAIPVVLDALRDSSKLLRENRILFDALGGVIKANAIILRTGLGFLKQQLESVQTVLQLTVAAFRQIKESIEYIVGHPIQLPGSVQPSQSQQQPAATATDQNDPFAEQLKNEIEARKRLQAVLNTEFAKRQQQADDAIALAQREFEAGRSTREELLQVILANNRKKAKAEIDSLENQRSINLKELALAKDDLDKRQQLANANLAIDAQVAAKRAELARSVADLTAKSRLDEQRDDLAREQARTETEAQLAQERIAQIEREIAEEVTAREEGLAQIEALENALLVRRGQLLKRELELAGVGPERDLVLEKIKAVEAERTSLERRQAERRKGLTRDEFESKRQIVLAGLEALIQVEQISNGARIAAIQALAAARIKTEEQAAREILAIRLRLIDEEIEAVRIRERAAAGITDPRERREAQAQAKAEIRVLNAQRVALQEEGNRDIDEARQRDLDNEQDYFNELRRISERVISLQRETAEEVIRLMALNHARRKDIIRAQRDLELQDEKDRHQRALEAIRAQQREVDSQIRLIELRLEAMRIGTTEEIEEHDRLIESLERLRLKRSELDAQADAEGALSDAITKGINAGADRAEDAADPFGRIKTGLEDIREFARELERSVVPLGEVLARTFGQVADAIGQTVANWVLLGTTGPAVMRKILAQALASIAAEAAVNAIKELALGFATLFFNPAESAGHFTAAALWGSIAGVSAVAGRAVAGNLFQPQQSGSGASGSGGRGTNERGEPNPIDLSRQQQTINVNIIVHGEPGPGFNQEVVRAVVHDVSINGPARDAIVKTAGG